MRKIAVAAGLALTVSMANMAWAAASKAADTAAASKPSDVSGKVSTVDAVNDVVTLANGQYYLVPPAIKLDAVKIGDQVTMSVDKDQYGINRVKALSDASSAK